MTESTENDGACKDIPTREDKEWLARGGRLLENSLSALNEAAKSIMTACTFLVTVYTFVWGNAGERELSTAWSRWMFAATVGLLALAFVLSLLVLVPFRYNYNPNSVTQAREIWRAATKRKTAFLWSALVVLGLGVVAFVCSILQYCQI